MQTAMRDKKRGKKIENKLLLIPSLKQQIAT